MASTTRLVYRRITAQIKTAIKIYFSETYGKVHIGKNLMYFLFRMV
jgi:hypothetical protein